MEKDLKVELETVSDDDRTIGRHTIKWGDYYIADDPSRHIGQPYHWTRNSEAAFTKPTFKEAAELLETVKIIGLGGELKPLTECENVSVVRLDDPTVYLWSFDEAPDRMSVARSVEEAIRQAYDEVGPGLADDNERLIYLWAGRVVKPGDFFKSREWFDELEAEDEAAPCWESWHETWGQPPQSVYDILDREVADAVERWMGTFKLPRYYIATDFLRTEPIPDVIQ